ncbi:hypothetical protein HU200_048675 [Digitaria exilis]|uniref:Rx N-terminal domain-containing protein n=1 Tax=Digitaria exilis TaxID=1010633 RepID=A0A835AUG9_9POAL|nr:hypothetical protein HU200_048675 [Digitaria exilis]
MELMTLSVGKSVVSEALGYAKSAFAEEVALQLGIHLDHAFIKDELEMMQFFLMEAHEERDDNKVVKTWVRQMKDLRARVEDVSQRNVRYRLIKGSGSKAAVAKHSSLISAAILGVDDYARRGTKQENQRVGLVQLINKEGDNLKVIAVWGASGDIGQMSIVREAYESPEVQSQFSAKAWVRVTHPFSPESFVQSLVNQFREAQGVDDLLAEKKRNKVY